MVMAEHISAGSHCVEMPSHIQFAFWHFDNVLWEVDGAFVIADLV